VFAILAVVDKALDITLVLAVVDMAREGLSQNSRDWAEISFV